MSQLDGLSKIKKKKPVMLLKVRMAMQSSEKKNPILNYNYFEQVTH